jgi:hypothetical protein
LGKKEVKVWPVFLEEEDSGHVWTIVFQIAEDFRMSGV